MLRRSDDRQKLIVIRYQRRDRRALRDLMDSTHHVHNHLDWFQIDEWLDRDPPYLWTAWHGTRLAGVLGMSEPLAGASWVRLVMARLDSDVDVLMSALWETMLPVIRAAGAAQIALLASEDWLLPAMGRLGFRYFDEIVTFRRTSMDLPEPAANGIRLRAPAPSEAHLLTQIDQAAFSPPWPMTAEDIRQAERISAGPTVALVDDRVVGFQFSTFYYDGAHLSRLAVLPAYQGRGIGRALVSDLILRLSKRSVYSLTVNTQLTNLRSQHLYQRLAFARTGYDLPVWTLNLQSP